MCSRVGGEAGGDLPHDESEKHGASGKSMADSAGTIELAGGQASPHESHPPDPHVVLARAPPAPTFDDECAICYDAFDDNESGIQKLRVELPCSHRFCSACIQKLREVAAARYLRLVWEHACHHRWMPAMPATA